jgi:hypothetical protein
MDVAGVKSSESVPCMIEVLPTDWVKESVIDNVMNENDQSHRSDVIYASTIVFCVDCVKIFRVSISYHFLCSCICLNFGPSVSIRYRFSMVSSLVMVALYTEYKMPIQTLDSHILLSKPSSVLNVA